MAISQAQRSANGAFETRLVFNCISNGNASHARGLESVNAKKCFSYLSEIGSSHANVNPKTLKAKPRLFIAAAKKRAFGTVLANLTDIERACLSSPSAGKSKERIVEHLGISPHTARHHRGRLMKKPGAHTIEFLCTLACRESLIDCTETAGYEKVRRSTSTHRRRLQT